MLRFCAPGGLARFFGARLSAVAFPRCAAHQARGTGRRGLIGAWLGLDKGVPADRSADPQAMRRKGSDLVHRLGFADGPSRLLGTHQGPAPSSRCTGEVGALRSGRVVLSRPSSLLRPPPTSSRPPATSRATGCRQGCDPRRRPGAEEDLSSTGDNPLAIPRPLRREVPGHPLQDPWCRPWPSPLGNRLGSPRPPGRRTGVTTLQASRDVADWSVARPRFAPGLSTTHGGFATGDLGVSPDRTCTGWLPSAGRSVTSQQPPCVMGAQAAGRIPQTPELGPPHRWVRCRSSIGRQRWPAAEPLRLEHS